MKRKYHCNYFAKLLSAVFLCLLCFGCNSSQQQKQGVVYQPKAKESTMTDEQRQAAIAQQRASLNGYMDSTNYRNAVKLTVMIPKVTDEFPAQAAELLASRMLQITAANGVAGYGGDPSLVFATLITPMQSGITSTVPQKKYTNYHVNFYVANILTGDVFGTATQEVMGVGDSDELACLNAMQSINNNDELKELLKQSSEKIVSWYEDNKATFIAQTNSYMQLGEYDKAYALLLSVPEAATSCFAFAQGVIDDVFAKYREKLSSSYYYSMLDAMADGDIYNPTVGAYMKQIPTNSPIYSTAAEAYHKYVIRCKDVADEQRAHEMNMEQERIAMERIAAEANLRANEALFVEKQAVADRLASGQESEPEKNSFGFKERITDLITDKAVSLVSFGVDRLLGVLGFIL